MRPLRPGAGELRVVGGLLGRVLVAASLLHVPAIVVAGALGELDDAAALLLAASLGLVAGRSLSRLSPRDADLRWATGMVVVAGAWLVAPLTVAVALLLSGHAVTPVDAYLDAMSGYTTSGLSVLQDLDHLGVGMQVLRHLTHFAGGQGIVLVVLTVLGARAGQVGTLMVGEGRDERLVPSVVRTARLIYLIAGAWAVVGTAALWVVLQVAGLTPWRSLAHAATLFMAAFDTGGFSMMSSSVAYYHSAWVELVLSVLMVAGALSFPVHWLLWRRRIGDATRQLDLRTLATTTMVLTGLLVLGLGAHQTYDGVAALSRKGVFTALSSASGTGFTVVAPQTYLTWGQLAPAAVVALMGIGAMAGSTAGGVKTIRVGLLAKSVLRDVRKSLAPPAQAVLASYRARRRVVIGDELARSAMTVTVLFLLTYVAGALAGVALEDVRIEDALFESVSATANVGLSIGVLVPSSTLAYKVVVIAQMWLGRLEFLAALALVGWLGQFAAAGVDRTRRGAPA